MLCRKPLSNPSAAIFIGDARGIVHSALRRPVFPPLWRLPVFWGKLRRSTLVVNELARFRRSVPETHGNPGRRVGKPLKLAREAWNREIGGMKSYGGFGIYVELGPLMVGSERQRPIMWTS